MSLPSTAIGEVRTTGADSQAGFFNPARVGTDYSQQDASQATGTVTSSTTTVTATTGIFTSVMVGNYITDGTTWKEITAFTSSTVVTVDSAPSWTAASIKVGGALASPGMAAGVIVAGNTVHLKSGTYTIASSTANISGGRVSPAAQSRWVGYVTTRGDAVTWGTMPSIKAGVNSIIIFAPQTNDVVAENIEVDGDSANRSTITGFKGTAGFRIRLVNCRAKACSSRAFGDTGAFWCWFCESVSCTSGEGFRFANGGFCFGCMSRSGVQGFLSGSAPTVLINCAAVSNSGDGFAVIFANQCVGCVSVSNGGKGFDMEAYAGVLTNCIAWGNTGLGFSTSTTANGGTVLLYNCAGGGNSANFNATDIPSANKPGFVTLTASPFVDAANRNFALNSTAGGGLLLKGLGFGSFPGGSTTGAPDIGATQNAASQGIFQLRRPLFVRPLGMPLRPRRSFPGQTTTVVAGKRLTVHAARLTLCPRRTAVFSSFVLVARKPAIVHVAPVIVSQRRSAVFSTFTAVSRRPAILCMPPAHYTLRRTVLSLQAAEGVFVRRTYLI